MDAVGKYIKNVSIGLALQHLKSTSKSHVAHHVECQTARPGVMFRAELQSVMALVSEPFV